MDIKKRRKLTETDSEVESDIESDIESDDEFYKVIKRATISKKKQKDKKKDKVHKKEKVKKKKDKIKQDNKELNAKLEECLIMDDSDEVEGEEDNVFMKKKPLKEKPKKPKVKKGEFVHDPEDTSKAYVMKLLGIREKTAENIEQVCAFSQPDILLSKISKFNNSNEAAYYIITRKLLEYKCDKCDMGPVWHGERLYLFLDHKNNLNNDYNLNNLRFLCPNCNTQLNGSGVIRNSTKATKKLNCITCNREFPVKRIKGGKCNECIQVEMDHNIKSKNFGFTQYMKNNSEIKYNLDKELFNGKVYNESDAVNQIMTQKHLDNEKEKEKLLEKTKHKRSKPKNDDKQIKKPTIDDIDSNAPLLEQILSKKGKNKKGKKKEDIRDRYKRLKEEEYYGNNNSNDNPKEPDDNNKDKKSHGFKFDF